MLEFVLGVTFFTGIAMALVVAILLARSRLIPAGGVLVRINDKRSVQVPVGVKLLAALDRAGLHLPSACGGRGTCGQCKVRVVKGRSAATPLDSALLSRREISSGMRLACQLNIHGDLDIRVADEVYGVKRWRCRVRSSRCVGTLMKELILELPPGESLEFRAGAFVQVSCPPFHVRFGDFELDPQIRDEWDRLGLWALEVDCQEAKTRAYSLANHPQEQGIAMLIVRLAIPPAGASPSVPPGSVSSYLFSLKPGDEVEIAGPYGHFFAPETQCEMIFVGGGAGMAPMRSHIFDQLKRIGSKRKISFWYGARNSRELFYVEDFAGLEQEYDNFRWYVALSEPAPGCAWQGDVGFIHQVLHDRYLAEHPNPEECEYYLCGPPVMIQALRGLLDQLGVDPENVSYDDFGG